MGESCMPPTYCVKFRIANFVLDQTIYFQIASLVRIITHRRIYLPTTTKQFLDQKPSDHNQTVPGPYTMTLLTTLQNSVMKFQSARKTLSLKNICNCDETGIPLRESKANLNRAQLVPVASQMLSLTSL